MAGLRSLIVKIGADDREIDRALTDLGSQAKKTDADLKKLGGTTIGQQAIASFDSMKKAMEGITKAQQALAERAVNAARGLDAIGGASKLTQSELEKVNKTLATGIDAYRALGEKAPADLQRVADAAKKQAQSLSGAANETGVLGKATTFLSAQMLALAGPAAIGFAIKQSIAYADTLTKMSDRTGIGVVAIQRLEAVAKASGNSIEDVAGAITQFQRRLGSGNDLAQPLRNMGIAIEEIRKQSPDEQFFAIARAIKGIQNPTEQTTAAYKLFGRSGSELMGTLKADVDSLADSTVTMSQESVKALDDFGDALTRLKTNATNKLGEIAGGVLSLMADMKALAKVLEKPGTGPMQVSAASIQQDRGGIVMTPRADPEVEEQARMLMAATEGLKQLGKAAMGATLPFKDMDKEIAEANAELGTLAQQSKRIQQSADLARALETINVKLAEAQRPIVALTTAQQKLAVQYKAFGLSAQDIGIKLGVSTRSIDAFTVGLDIQQKSALATDRVFGRIGSVTIPQLAGQSDELRNILSGLTSDGLLPASDTTAKFNKHLQTLNDTGKHTGQSFDEARVGVDTFGNRANALVGILNNINDSFAQTATVAVRAGLEIRKALTPDENGDRDWSAAIGAGASALATVTKGSSILGGAARGAAIGAIAGPWGAAAGAAIGAVVGALKDAEKQVNPVRQAFVDMAGGLGALNQKAAGAGVTLKAMLDARTPEAYKKAIDDLNGAFAFQDAAMKTLDETTQKYGFTLAELGPAFQRQELDKKAQELFQDFKVLTSAGIETSVVIDRMGASINAFVESARSTGTEVPAALKPMLQQMVDMGRLTDASGNAFTSLEGIGLSFSETMSEGFTRVVDEVKKLTDAISRGLGLAIQNVPDVRVTGRVDWEVDEPPSWSRGGGFAASGGRVTARGVQRFAGGGNVLPFFRKRGTDTVPAMLTPGEVVLTRGQQQAVSSAMGTPGSSVDTSRVEGALAALRGDLARDRSEMPAEIARHVRTAVQKVVRR